MKISIGQLSYRHTQDCVTWLSQHVSEQKYYLHNQIGGLGWRYYLQDRTVEIEDEQLATLFILKFGG
jgi:hypothetical protein